MCILVCVHCHMNNFGKVYLVLETQFKFDQSIHDIKVISCEIKRFLLRTSQHHEHVSIDEN